MVSVAGLLCGCWLGLLTTRWSTAVTVKSYRDLIAWQKAMDLTEMVYRSTYGFPREELYGLTSQIRRATLSIASNIAEGQGRRTTKDFVNFLFIALGSRNEAETQVLLALRLGYVDQERCDALLNLSAEVGRLINGLANSLQPQDQE